MNVISLVWRVFYGNYCGMWGQNALIQEGKEMASVLYTYRSCVKALPQVYFGFNSNKYEYDCCHWNTSLNNFSFFSGSLKNVYDVAASRIHEAQSGWLVSGDVSSFGLGDESFAWNPEMASIGCIESIWSLTFFYLLVTVMYHVWFLLLLSF